MKRRGLATLLVVLLSLLTRVYGVNTFLQVLSPSSLIRPDGYNHEASEFGFSKCPIKQATTTCLLEATILPLDVVVGGGGGGGGDNNSLCNGLSDGLSSSSSSSSSSLVFSGGGEAYVILADRDDSCSFVSQARKAQELGASGLFLADHTCLCSLGGFCTNSGSGTIDNNSNNNNNNNNPTSGLCAAFSPKVTNDGTGNDIVIPTLLLQKQDSDAIRNVLLSGKQQQPAVITTKLEWELPSFVAATEADGSVVTLDYWHIPSPTEQQQQQQQQKQDLLISLGEAITQLAVQSSSSSTLLQFTPKFYILDGTKLGCHPAGNSNSIVGQQDDASIFCSSRCTNNGRYCAENVGGVAGARIVQEALRRMCMWELYNNEKQDEEDDDTIGGTKYWKYLTAFSEEGCTAVVSSSTGKTWEDDTCSRAAMVQAGMNYMKISQCVIQSGGTSNDSENRYMESNLREQRNIVGLDPPSLVVNSVQFQSQTFSDALGAICAGYNYLGQLGGAVVPQSCTACVNCAEAEQFNCVVNQEVCVTEQEQQTPAPSMAPVFGGATEGNQDTLNPVQAQPTLKPTTWWNAPTVDNQNFLAPTNSADLDTELPLVDPTEEKEQAEISGDDGGLSDNTKVVIVVAVVGGAIVVIFAFVIFLVFKLLKRIRKLEKKEKQTPTTTSPAGSNIWDLPHYVGKEDPFNSDCDPIPPEVFDQIEREPVPNTTNNITIDDGGEKNPKNSSALPNTPTAEPNRGVLVTDQEPTNVPQLDENALPRAGMADARNNSLAVSTGSERQSTKIPEKLQSTSGKIDTAVEKPKARPRKTSKRDPTWVDIMGKSAPEAKFPKSFSYDDEEKEEIVDDSSLWEGSDAWDAEAAALSHATSPNP